MHNLLNDKAFDFIAAEAYSDCITTSAIWCSLDNLGKSITYNREVAFNIELKKAIFFHILKMLMSDGRLRLAKNGQFLVGSIDEQLERFKEAFPKSEESQKEIGGISTWFFMDECPAGAVWVYKLEDGTEHLEWT